jgi:hypothetical protein
MPPGQPIYNPLVSQLGKATRGFVHGPGSVRCRVEPGRRIRRRSRLTRLIGPWWQVRIQIAGAFGPPAGQERHHDPL